MGEPRLRLAGVGALLVVVGTADMAGAGTNRSWLGIGVATSPHGVKITHVVDDTPAQYVGLLRGDSILAVDGRTVVSDRQLIRRLAVRAPDEVITLRVRRGRYTFLVDAVLEEMPDDGEILRRRLVGKRAPEFSLMSVLTGDRKAPPALSQSHPRHRVHDLRGSVVVILFWATWNRAGAEMHRALELLAKTHGGRGLSVLAISSESQTALRSYAQRLGQLTVLKDVDSETRRRYFVPALPTLVVLDRQGVVVYAGVGTGSNWDHATYAAERQLRKPVDE